MPSPQKGCTPYKGHQCLQEDQLCFACFVMRNADCVELQVAECIMEAMLYLATSCSLLPLALHKRLPRTETVLKGVAVPQ